MARFLTATMREAMRRSVQVVSQVDILQNDRVILSTTNNTMKLSNGDVSWDTSRDVVGQANLSLQVDDQSVGLIPRDLRDPLSPISTSLVRVRHGFITSIGPEYVALGDFDPSDVDISESGGGVLLSITAYDKTRRMHRDRFTAVYVIAAGTNVVAALITLVQRTYPTVTFLFTATAHVTPLLAFEIGDDPLAKGQELAASIGYEMFFNSNGDCVIRPLLEPAGASPDWTLTEGTSDTKMLAAGRRLSDDDVYNGVVMRGESFSSTDDPIQVEVWDTDPRSPTYYDPAAPGLSTYGPAPFFETSEYVTTEAQGLDAARGRLLLLKGLAEQTNITTRVNPGIEVNDILQIERSRIGTRGAFLADAVSFGLKASTMSITTRERRIL